MSTFLIPKTLCKDLDACVRKFWWQANSNSKGFLAFKRWKDICKLKPVGGLGFWKFSHMNVALLSKLTWRMANDKNFLWIRCLKAKYLKGQSIFETSFCKRDSFTWKNILAGKKPIFKRARFKLGNGRDIHPLYDPWIPLLENGLLKLRGGTNPKSIWRVFELRKHLGSILGCSKSQGHFWYYLCKCHPSTQTAYNKMWG